MLKFKGAPLYFLFLLAALLFTNVSCSLNKVYSRGALFDTILRPYPSEPGKLVNQRCIKYEKNNCVETDKLIFDLKNPKDKKQLIDLKFICNVAGQRFGICHEQSGLCQIGPYGKRPCLFCSRQVVILKILDIEKDFQYILNSNTICAAQDSFIGQRLF